MKKLYSRLSKLERFFGKKPPRYVVFFRDGETDEQAIARAQREDPTPLNRHIMLMPEKSHSIEEWEAKYGS